MYQTISCTAQKRYTTTERSRELLSAIETCKKYKNILLGYPIIVFTDYKINTFNDLKALDSILCWYSIYYSLKNMEYVGTVADVLYRLYIYSLKKTQEEVLTLLSGSENNTISISN
jgi:hypothetical protein